MKNVTAQTAIAVFAVLLLFRVLSLRHFERAEFVFELCGYAVISAVFGLVVSYWWHRRKA